MEGRSRLMQWTRAEFARLPGERSTGYEVIAGELVAVPEVAWCEFA